METAKDTTERLQKVVDEARNKLREAKTLGQDAQDLEKHLAEAEKRLSDLKGGSDKLIGDNYDSCYESIAKLAATKAPEVWEAMKTSVASNLKDVIMSCKFEDLFEINSSNGALGDQVNNRKIAEIEKIIFEKAKGSGPGKGIVLRFVDINEIHFPEKVKEKLIMEVTALTEERIKLIEARTKETTSQSEANVMRIEADARSVARVTEARAEHTAAQFEARALIERAVARARAVDYEGRGIARARAEAYRQIIQTLRDQEQPEETIRVVLQNLAASISTTHYIQGQYTNTTLPETTSDQNEE
jgi:hypothetical protein